MWGLLWTAVGCILAVNAIVLAGVVVSAAREAHGRKQASTEPDGVRQEPPRVVGSARWTKVTGAAYRSRGGSVAGWGLVVILLATGSAFASSQARDAVGAVLGRVADGLGVGAAERASAAGDQGGGVGGGHPGPVGGDARSSGTHPGAAPPGTGPTAGEIPEAPEDVTAVVQSATQIDLLWTDVDNETGYTVERRSEDGAWIEVATTRQGETTASDTDLVSDTTYLYRVIAISAGTESLPSDVTTITTPPTPPLSPDLSAELASSTEIALEWGDVTGATEYRIERSTDGATGWVLIATLGQEVTHYLDSPLAEGVTFHYRIFAANAGGDSAASNVVWATTSPSAPPAEVTDAPSPTADEG